MTATKNATTMVFKKIDNNLFSVVHGILGTFTLIS